MSQYFPKPYEPFGGDINVKVDLSNYATKTDFKNVSHADVGSFALKSNLASLKTKVDKLDIDKLVPISVDLSKLSDVVKNDVIKKTEYNKLVTNVDNIDTANFGKKNKYEKDGSDFEDKISKIYKKIPDVSGLVKKKTDFNTKDTEIEGKIPSITGLATNTELTAVENKIPDISSLVKKTDYNTKISDIEKKITDHEHDKYITTPEFNTIAASVFNATLAAQTDLIRKPEFDFKLKGISDRVTLNKSKYFLVENELNKLEKFDGAYYRGKNYFEDDGTQNYLVFQGACKYFQDVDVSKALIKFHANSWISKGLSNEKMCSVTGFERPFIEYANSRIKLKFDESILRQKLSTSIGLIANYYIVYRLSPRTNSSRIVLENCLFRKIKMTKNADTDKYKYQGHGIGFDLTFTHPNGSAGENVIIFGVDMTNSKHANNKTKDVLVLGRGLIQKIDDTTIYAEKMYSPNFTIANKTFCLSLHYNGDDSYLCIRKTIVRKHLS